MPDKQPEPKPDPEPSEQDNVLAWRVLCVAALGYDWVEAVQIAESGADIHELADLVNGGCPRPLAVEIVL